MPVSCRVVMRLTGVLPVWCAHLLRYFGADGFVRLVAALVRCLAEDCGSSCAAGTVCDRTHLKCDDSTVPSAWWDLEVPQRLPHTRQQRSHLFPAKAGNAAHR